MAQFSAGSDANYTTVVAHRDKASSTYQAGGTPATGTGVTGYQKQLWMEAFIQYICGCTTDGATTIATILSDAIKAADYACQQDGNHSVITGAGTGTWVVGSMGS